VELLNKFAANKRNEVWLLSGLPVKSLEQVAARAPGVGMVAENGCFVRVPGRATGDKAGAWITMVANLNLTWKPLCVEILNYVRVSVRYYQPLGTDLHSRVRVVYAVHRTHAWLVRSRARGVCCVAILDWPHG
jgi:hypothetical protein